MSTVLAPRPTAARPPTQRNRSCAVPPPAGLRHGRPPTGLRAAWNTVKAAVLLAALGGLLVLVGSLFGELGAAVGLMAGVALAGGSYWFSDRLALRAAGAVPVRAWELPEYHRIVRELCRDAGLPMPRLYLTPDQQPNAFATGRSPRRAAVAVTRGLLELLSPRELRAVLAHELAHVGNRDILLTSVAAAVATGITFLANVAGWLPLFGGADDEDDGPGPLGLVLASLLAPLAATVLQLALSRSREYEADRIGATLLGDARALASALARIDAVSARRPMHVEPAQAGKYLVNPLRGRRAGLAALFSTHPPVEARLARLTQLD